MADLKIGPIVYTPPSAGWSPYGLGHIRGEGKLASLRGPISSGFGPRAPIMGQNGQWTSNGHWALDVAMAVGTPLPALADGVLQITDAVNDRDGKWVRYACGKAFGFPEETDVLISYLHCDLVIGQPGMRVIQGQVVALSGNTGLSTGPHVHISIYAPKMGGWVDPRTVFVGYEAPHVAPVIPSGISPALTPGDLPAMVEAINTGAGVTPMYRLPDGKRQYRLVLPV